MEFMLTFQQPVAAYESHIDPLAGAPILQAWGLYIDALTSAGVLRGGNKLDALDAKAVRIRNGRLQIQDGSFADSKELLGGYVLIDVPSLEDALNWAERSPSSLVGSTGVWPVTAGKQK